MKQAQINSLYQRGIDTLIKEIESFSDEDKLWQALPGINNTGGNLALHLWGSLNSFLGATLANTGFKRDRDAEFSTKGISKVELITRLTITKKMVQDTMENISDEDLQKDFPFDFAGKESTEYYLLFFVGHLNYHTGQINYLRRIIG